MADEAFPERRDSAAYMLTGNQAVLLPAAANKIYGVARIAQTMPCEKASATYVTACARGVLT